MAPKMYIAGRGTSDETKTSSSPTVTMPLSPSVEQGPGGGLDLVGRLALARRPRAARRGASPAIVVT